MAWEEESIETGADFQEVGGGKNKLKLIIILLVVVGLAAAGWFFKDKIFGGDDKPEKAVKEGKDSENKGANKAAASEDDDTETDDDDDDDDDTAAGFRVNLEKFTINLSGDGQHFLVTSIVLEVSTEVLRDEFIDPDDKALTMIKTRDMINSLLRQKTYAQMRDADEVNEAAAEIKHKLSRKLKSGKVLSVYFSEFLVD